MPTALVTSSCASAPDSWTCPLTDDIPFGDEVACLAENSQREAWVMKSQLYFTDSNVESGAMNSKIQIDKALHALKHKRCQKPNFKKTIERSFEAMRSPMSVLTSVCGEHNGLGEGQRPRFESRKHEVLRVTVIGDPVYFNGNPKGSVCAKPCNPTNTNHVTQPKQK